MITLNPPEPKPSEILRIEDLRKVTGHFILATTTSPARFFTAVQSPSGERELRSTFDDPDVARFPSKTAARDAGKSWGLATWRYAKIIDGEICNWWPQLRCWIPQRWPAHTYVKVGGKIMAFGGSSFPECSRHSDED